MSKVKSLIIIFDDGTSETIVVGFNQSSQTTQRRRRAKRECSICGEKFFAPGLGTHMKMCRRKSPEQLKEERQARANLL